MLRVRRKGTAEHYVGRRYGDFARLYKRLRTELPGKVLPPIPQKNKSHSVAPSIFGSQDGNNSETSSVSSVSTQLQPLNSPPPNGVGHQSEAVSRLLSVKGEDYIATPGTGSHSLTCCVQPDHRSGERQSPRNSVDGRPSSPSLLSPKPQETVVIWRESQRISLRAFLRSLLQNPQIATTKAMEEFLAKDPVTLSDDDVEDVIRRKHVDKKRVEEQKQFYEVARKRAAELDVYMEQ